MIERRAVTVGGVRFPDDRTDRELARCRLFDWFEDRRTSETAFAEVLGNDLGRLPAGPAGAAAPAGPARPEALRPGAVAGQGRRLRVLDRLRLPPDTEHLAPLRKVLADGYRNHYRSPDAWDRPAE